MGPRHFESDFPRKISGGFPKKIVLVSLFSPCIVDSPPKMYTPGIPGWVRVQGQRGHPPSMERQSLVSAPAVKPERGRVFTEPDASAQRMRDAALCRAVVPQLRDERGFTLLELLIVVGIIGLLLVLMTPAFTYIKGGTDLTSAAYTIKGVLDTARTYAKANNTYTWVGFAGSVGPNTQPYITGQVEVAIVASKDGTNLWSANNALPAGSLIQVGKMETLSNIHIGDTGTPQPSPSPAPEFENRATVDSDHKISTSANTPYPFTVQQTTFNKWIQFSPRGEALVHGGNFSIVQYAEVGLLPTHGTVLAVTQSGNLWLGNLAAIQIGGFGGNVRIYRR
jgi:prepilin-type N-terminal cleavage/methylation domain-containing protein